MAHITEIKIDGLLGRKEPINIKLQRDVNIFFGENGCGKTTLLKILDAAMSYDWETMERLPVERAEVHVFSITRNRLIKHTWERKHKGSAGSKEDFYILDDEATGIRRAVVGHAFRGSGNSWKTSPSVKDIHRWSHTFLPTTRLYLEETPSRAGPDKQMLGERRLDALFAESINRTWLVYYTQILTEVRRIQEAGLRAVLNNVLSFNKGSPTDSKIPTDEAFDRVVKFLKRHPEGDATMLGTKASFKKRYEKDENLRRVVDNLHNVEKSIETAMIPIDRFKNTIESLFSRGKKLTPSNSGLQIKLENDQLLSPADLSSGEKHLLKILLAAMNAEENSVMIDEPELSMHIDWQRIFVRTIQELNPDCQLILASHSPEIMADIPDEKIFRI